MTFPTTGLRGRYEARLDTATSGIDDVSGNNRPLSSGLSITSNAINGHPAYACSNGNKATRDETNQAFAQYTISAVLSSYPDEAIGRCWPFGCGTSGGSTATIFAFTESHPSLEEWGSFVRNGRGGNDPQIATYQADTTQWCVLTLTYDGTNVEYYMNGTLVGTDRVGSPGSISLGHTFIGGFINQYLTGYVALGAEWTTYLDAPKRAALHSYVQDTYGIAVSDYVATEPDPTTYFKGWGLSLP